MDIGIPLVRWPHTGHGPHRPTSGTPDRAPHSIRRTITIEVLRPDGLTGPLQLHGLGRDLSTGWDLEPQVRDRASVRATVDYHGGKTLVELNTNPSRAWVPRLRGTCVTAGLRSTVGNHEPGLAETDALLYQLLDDLPMATMLGGHAQIMGSLREPSGLAGAVASVYDRPDWATRVRDLCAGWAGGGTMMNEVDATGKPPLVVGPPAPSLLNGDPWAWDGMRPLPPHGMRRARRIDVRRGTYIEIDAFLRDSYQPPNEPEQVLHEYLVAVVADCSTLQVIDCRADARVLPWTECSPAADSAPRLIGRFLPDLAAHVRSRFVGTTTCTHLNDTLRVLATAETLIRRLPDQPNTGPEDKRVPGQPDVD